MPIYEYQCDTCGRRFSALVGVVAGGDKVACPRCGGGKLTKLVSRFVSPRSEGDLDDDLGDVDDLDADPQAARRWARRLGREFGEDLGDDFEDEVASAMDEEAQADETGADDEDL
jgi:putative FmdB family regulatory protein